MPALFYVLFADHNMSRLRHFQALAHGVRGVATVAGYQASRKTYFVR